MGIKFELFDYEDETVFLYETTVELPSKRIVCPRCNGDGTHTNPNVDGNGISAEEFAEDPDFAENYFSGVYDVICYECKGNKVMDVVDQKRIPPEYKKQYENTVRCLAEWKAEEAAHARACEQGWGW